MKKLYTFRLLGPFEVFDPDGAPVDFGHRKAGALMAYLAVERVRPQHREQLASLLWARTGEERARHNLRQALSKLRTLCANVLETSGERVTINPDACHIDVAQFEPLARSDDPEALLQALDLYRGDLLDGYSTNESDYQDWLDLTRSRLRKQTCELAGRLAAMLETAGRASDAIAVLNRLLSLDRANELAHRNLMQLLANSGQRSEALRQYQECATALAQELGGKPILRPRRCGMQLARGLPLLPLSISPKTHLPQRRQLQRSLRRGRPQGSMPCWRSIRVPSCLGSMIWYWRSSQKRRGLSPVPRPCTRWRKDRLGVSVFIMAV